MIVPFELNNKRYNIEAYDTAKEKELLLMSSFGVDDIDEILKLLGFTELSELSNEEKKVILYKYREVSLGDEIDIKFTCDDCGQGNDAILEANNFVKAGKFNDSHIKKINGEFHEDNMNQYVDFDVDDLDLDEYEELLQRIIDNQIEINFIKQAKCLKCGSEKNFDLGQTKYILEIMSDDSLMSLYKAYNFLVFFGHYSKQDIDSMYPFERSIFIGLLNKTKEDLAK